MGIQRSGHPGVLPTLRVRHRRRAGVRSRSGVLSSRLLWPYAGVVHPDRLFLETLADLEKRAATDGTEYEALMIAALLRKLVLDAHPLVDEVNRRYRLKVRYRINDTKPPAVPGHLVAWNALDGLDPETAGSPEPKVVSIDGLLRQSVMISDGHVYTVRDLISHQANAAGAVHVGPGRGAAASALRQNELSREEAEWPMQAWNLRSIARVVLAGLRELRDAVRANLE
jgi:hypothetical protein